MTAVLPPAPVRLPPNYVWRSYRGGGELRRFREGSVTADDHFPEDWLASTVPARNGGNRQSELEGISRLGREADSGLLKESLTRNRTFWWGDAAPANPDPGVLWKLLDAADRLQLQAHPDVSFARRHLNAAAGKTECWYVLATRGPAHVFLGFQRSPGRERWGRMIRAQQSEEMLGCFDPIPVRAGDCLVVPAGTPHAIGAGIFMLELQEPTDWVVRCETRTTDGKPLSPDACFMGLDLERCLDVFDYRASSVEQVRQAWLQQPRVVRSSHGFCEEEVIGAGWHQFFRLHRLRGSGPTTWSGSELILAIMLKGRGELRAQQTAHPCCAGETWLLPGCVTEWEWRSGSPEWELLLARPPRHAHAAHAATGLV